MNNLPLFVPYLYPSSFFKGTRMGNEMFGPKLIGPSELYPAPANYIHDPKVKIRHRGKYRRRRIRLIDRYLPYRLLAKRLYKHRKCFIHKSLKNKYFNVFVLRSLVEPERNYKTVVPSTIKNLLPNVRKTIMLASPSEYSNYISRRYWFPYRFTISGTWESFVFQHKPRPRNKLKLMVGMASSGPINTNKALYKDFTMELCGEDRNESPSFVRLKKRYRKYFALKP